MKTVNDFNGNVQHLIKVNYQRMMAFEQAAFNSPDESLRSFYAARADESEAYLKELCSALNVHESIASDIQCNDLLKNITTKKTAIRMLDFIIAFEKTVVNWYKKAITDIQSFPAELNEILSRQYKAVGASQLALQEL